MAKNKNKITLVDEGIEDPLEQEIAQIRKEMKEAKKEKPYEPINPYKLFVIICIWIFFFRQSINFGWGSVYFMISILVFIFNNLGKRKPWELSAYSVYNRNFERLPGTLSVNDLQPGLNNNNNFGIENELVERELNPTTLQEREELNRLNRINYFNVSTKNEVKYETKFEQYKQNLKEKAAQPLNSNCNCGSGKKYKNCCLKFNQKTKI